MKKCIVKQATESRFTVKFELTPGDLLALQHALQEYNTVTGRDVRTYLENACREAGVQE